MDDVPPRLPVGSLDIDRRQDRTTSRPPDGRLQVPTHRSDRYAHGHRPDFTYESPRGASPYGGPGLGHDANRPGSRGRTPVEPVTEALNRQMYLAAGLAALNVILLTALSIVWVGNYRTFGTAVILGLSTFGVVLLVENAVALYYFLTMDMLYAEGSTALRDVLTGLRGLQTVALAVLTWATLQ